jgi:hypothetical protein
MRGRRLVVLAGTVACALTWTAAGWSAMAAAQPGTAAQAKTHLLVLADLPKGWSTEKGTANTQNAAYPAGSTYTACLGPAAGLPEAVPPEVDSPYFQNKDGSQEIQDAISTFKTSATAKSSFAALSSPAFAGCASSALNAYLKANPPQGATLGTLTVSPPLGAKFGAHTNGFVLTSPITTQGQTVIMMTTTVFFIRGTLGQQLTFTEYGAVGGSGTPFPPAEIRHMITVAERKL